MRVCKGLQEFPYPEPAGRPGKAHAALAWARRALTGGFIALQRRMLSASAPRAERLLALRGLLRCWRHKLQEFFTSQTLLVEKLTTPFKKMIYL